jgi:hypothetical protein
MVHASQGSTPHSPLNTKSLCTFLILWPICGLPCRLIGFACGLVGAAHAAPGHASNRATSITLHNFALVCWLERRCSDEGECIEMGEIAREPSAYL